MSTQELNTNDPDKHKQIPPQQGEQGAALTSRPMNELNRSGEPGTGTQIQGMEEDESLRELEPRSVKNQFGESPDIKPVPDQEGGTKDWYEHSDGMKKSFPDDAPDDKDGPATGVR